MPHILQYISEHWAPPPEVKTENGHMHQEGDAPPPQTAQLLAAIITVLLQHGRLRCAATRLDGFAVSGTCAVHNLACLTRGTSAHLCGCRPELM